MELDKFFLGNEGLFNYLNHLLDDFIMIEFWCQVKFIQSENYPFYQSIDVDWVNPLFSNHDITSGMVKDALENHSEQVWQKEDQQDGCHLVRALCKIEFDSDGYQKWCWITFLYTETELKLTTSQLEQMEKEAEKYEKENAEDHSSFLVYPR